MDGVTSQPLICVSLAEADPAACLAALEGVACAEIRLDAMRATPADVRRVFQSHQTLVATCRPGSHGDEQRRDLLLAAIDGGAAFVDLEMEAPTALHTAIVAAARAARCRLILSFHDVLATPELAALQDIRERCFDAGADWTKIACHVRSKRDAVRLLSLLDDDRPVIVVGMGPLGRVVRLAAPLLGSPLAYAAAAPGRQTAPGQPARAELERLLREWSDG